MTEKTPPILNRAALDELCTLLGGGAEGRAAVLELIELFEGEVTSCIERVVQAQGAGDPAAAVRVAHSLKSSSRALGALALSARLAELEGALRAEDRVAQHAAVGMLPELIASSLAALRAW